MKRVSLSIIFIFMLHFMQAQIPLPCVDSLHHPANPYYACYDGFNPVCGCDSNTYRSACCAYNKAGLSDQRPGICRDRLFMIDLVPNPVEREPAQFGIAIRNPSTAYVFITDVFGGTVFTRNIYSEYNEQIISFEIDMNGFRNGVYALIAVVEGEKKYVKFVKVKY